MFRRTAITILPALAALAVGACSGAAVLAPTATPAPVASAAPTAAATTTVKPSGTPYHVNVPLALQGKYTGKILGTSISSGTWAIEITHNEIMATNPSPGAEAFAVGVTDITPERVTFFADPECAVSSVEGVYSYALVNNELRFTAIADDACLDRQALLTTTAWQRQP